MEEGCARWLSFENNGPLCPLGGGSSQAVIWFPFYNRVLLDSKPQACVGRLGLWRACPPQTPFSLGDLCPFLTRWVDALGGQPLPAFSTGRHRLAGTGWQAPLGPLSLASSACPILHYLAGSPDCCTWLPTCVPGGCPQDRTRRGT